MKCVGSEQREEQHPWNTPVIAVGRPELRLASSPPI